ncbi:copper resistance CopC/CopD family protein [Thermoleophilum album]|uniref:Copper-binding protein CopC (Methionine-rich) n=1 Tax=Thermoleophilum album TaxID=29539 RepID=A0A1H6FK31_THEAL|nr:copper resistance protein CopC [Thermoleophilum album]SEH10518.1 Copper-binding protein CopC (methionine-rich) [Thermoleophilum album]
MATVVGRADGAAVGRPPRIASTLAVGLVVLLASLLSAPRASAHASLVASDPSPGARLESAPTRLELRFSEPLAARLSRAQLVDASGRPLATSMFVEGRRIVVEPRSPMPRGGYRLDWSTVSTVDGHTLAGSVGFGVRAPPLGSSGALAVGGPFDLGGLAGLLGRVLLYVGLVGFAGPLFVAVLLGARKPSQWLVPDVLGADGTFDGRTLARRRAAFDGVHALFGLAAVAGALAVALADATRAAGTFDPAAIFDFLLANRAGLGRFAAALALALAVLAPARRQGLRAGAALVAIVALAAAGHAASAQPQALAITALSLHVAAGCAWLGGILAIALTWWSLLRRAGDHRTRLLPAVLEPFGLVALPAFVLVVAAGTVNAVIALGSPKDLLDTAWGRVLLLKIEFVGFVALLSALHALRWRRRIAGAGAPARLVRRHWRVVRAQPWLVPPVLVASALLTGFALPPRQVAATLASADPFGCRGCPPRAPLPGELAVADHAGPVLVAAWVRPERGGRAAFELRLRQLRGEAFAPRPRVPGAERLRSCGPGCWQGLLTAPSEELEVTLARRGQRVGVARLPLAVAPHSADRARRLLTRAERRMRKLAAVREDETLTSGVGRPVVTRYALVAPDRLAFRFSQGGGGVVIGARQWRVLPDGRVESSPYVGRFRSASWFRWTAYARYAWLLRGDRRYLRIALFDPGTPIWYRLAIERRRGLVRAVRMIAPGHYMTQTFYAFDQPTRIVPPPPTP